MSLICADGLGWFTSEAGAAPAWKNLSSELSTTEGRQGGNAIALTSGGTTLPLACYRTFPRPLTPATGKYAVISFYLKHSVTPTALANSKHWGLQDESFGEVHTVESYFGQAVNAIDDTIYDSRYSIYTGMTADNWYRMDWWIYYDSSSGFVNHYRDGALIHSLTGVDTIRSANPAVALSLGRMASSGTAYFNDLLVYDDGGELDATNGPIGNYIINTYFPDADGTTNQWTPQGAGSNYVEVDESNPDGDTTYVETSTDGNRELYSFGSIGDPRTIHTLSVKAVAKLDTGSANANIKGACKSGTTTITTEGQTVDNETYNMYEWGFDKDPDAGSADWDQTSVNAAEFGFEFEDIP